MRAQRNAKAIEMLTIPTQTEPRDCEFRNWIMANVEMIRVKDGAAGASHQACLTKTPDPTIG
jgi:hypothetical protein